MADSMFNAVVTANLNTLLRLFKSHPEDMTLAVTALAKQKSLEDIILLRAMLRDMEYTLKTAYDTDDRRINTYCFIICKIFDTNMDKMASRDKTNDLPIARQLLTYYLTKINVPRSVIISLMDYSDPSIIIYNLKRIGELIDTGDVKTMSLINAINTQLYLKS